MNTFFNPEIPNRVLRMRSHKSLVLSALLITLFAAFAFVKASAADSTTPQARSDGVVATLEDTVEAKNRMAAAKADQALSDGWITTKVKSEIFADSVSKGLDVNVRTNDGVVPPRGTVANREAVNHVKDVVENVDGVKSADTSQLIVANR